MKAKILAFVCVLLVLCMGSVFAQEMTVDEFLDAFEDLVLEVEEAAEEDDISNYEEFVSDYADFLEFYEAVDTDDWSYDQIMAFSALSQRYSIAIISLTDTTSEYVDMYGAYGF